MKNFKTFAAVLFLFSYSLVSLANTIVVSDIDDTIKKANSMGGVGGVYHFLRKKPYNESRDLFNEIRKEENNSGGKTTYYYVSAAPSYTFDADEWIAKNNFPIGPTYLKTRENGGETYEYKYRTIKTIIEQELKADPGLKIIFFGDNSQHDAKVYYDLRKNMQLGNAHIYVRDVSTEATFFSTTLPVIRLPDVNYFFSEVELIDHPDFMFMSEKLRNLINKNYHAEILIPQYTFDTLVDRLKDICQQNIAVKSCRTEAKLDASKYWSDYYNRF
jgi:hypothetical protein